LPAHWGAKSNAAPRTDGTQRSLAEENDARPSRAAGYRGSTVQILVRLICLFFEGVAE